MNTHGDPLVTQFTNSRDFLNAFVASQRIKSKSWSVSGWAKRLGASDPSTLTKVLNGKRKIGPKLAQKICDSLNLNESESKYFKFLAKLDESRHSDHIIQTGNKTPKGISSPPFEKILGSDPSISLFSDWYVVVIREILLNSGLELTTAKLSRMIRPKISKESVEDALAKLQKIGEVTVDARGRWKSRNVFIETAQDVSISTARRYQRRCLELEKVAIESIAVSDRDIQTLTFAYRLEDLKLIKKTLRAFKQSLLDQFEVKDDFDTPYAIAQFHQGFFPVSYPILN